MVEYVLVVAGYGSNGGTMKANVIDIDWLSFYPSKQEENFIRRQAQKLLSYLPAESNLSLSVGQESDQFWANVNVRSNVFSTVVHAHGGSLRAVTRKLEKELKQELRAWRSTRFARRPLLSRFSATA